MHYFMVGFCQGLFLFSVVQDHSVNVKLGELGVGQLRLVLGLQAGGAALTVQGRGPQVHYITNK